MISLQFCNTMIIGMLTSLLIKSANVKVAKETPCPMRRLMMSPHPPNPTNTAATQCIFTSISTPLYIIFCTFVVSGRFSFFIRFPYIFNKNSISAKEGFNGYISGHFLLDSNSKVFTGWLIVVKYDVLRQVAK